MLPPFEPGQTIVVEERWKWLLWSAVPQLVVDGDSHRLVTYVPAGTVSVVGSNRHVPGADQLTRSERKLEALKMLQVRPLAISETPDKLYFYTSGSWARVNLGWDPTDGHFMGWYVNFEQPVVGTAQGLAGKDLVLDLYIEPDGVWTAWKWVGASRGMPGVLGMPRRRPTLRWTLRVKAGCLRFGRSPPP